MKATAQPVAFLFHKTSSKGNAMVVATASRLIANNKSVTRITRLKNSCHRLQTPHAISFCYSKSGRLIFSSSSLRRLGPV